LRPTCISPSAAALSFLCCGRTEPQCRGREVGREAWEYLKRRLAEPGLPGRLDRSVYRNRANCLRICERGPSRCGYVWYRLATPAVLERIVPEHLIGGRVVVEWAFARSADGL
jgi:(2Fe-2S) ferredoxin